MSDIDKKPLSEKRKPNTASRQPPPAEEPVAPPGPDAPYWIPDDYRWQDMPQRVREAVPRILAPAYRRFVLEAPGELERSVGLTLVHLTWLELCDQIKLAVAAADPDSLEAILKSPEDMLDRHLRLATVKCQTAELLLKLQVVQNALQRSEGASGLSSTIPIRPALPSTLCPEQGEPHRKSSPPGSDPFPLPLENGNSGDC